MEQFTEMQNLPTIEEILHIIQNSINQSEDTASSSSDSPEPSPSISTSRIIPQAEKPDENMEIDPVATQNIITEILETFDDPPKLIKLMISKNLLRSQQTCKKCRSNMHLRRRKHNLEWRCRAKNKSDCSSCSIKFGSWFEYSKLSFKTMFTFLIMHCQNYPSVQIMRELSITAHTVIEFKKVIYGLSTRVVNRYPKIGGIGSHVHIEMIMVSAKKTGSKGFEREPVRVLAGHEIGTRRCFAKVISDQDSEDHHKVNTLKKKLIREGSIISERVIMEDLQVIVYFNSDGTTKTISTNDCDESDMIFKDLKKPVIESCATNDELLQDFLNDAVVRHIEGDNYLYACFREIQRFI